MNFLKGIWEEKFQTTPFRHFFPFLNAKQWSTENFFHKVDRFFSSSKKCFKYGNAKSKKEQTLKDHQYNCKCGHKMDRDLSAAINTLREGASSLGLDGVIPDFALVSVT
jgi:transposase